MKRQIRAVVFDIGGVLEAIPRTGWEDSWCVRLGVDKDAMHSALRHLWIDGTVGAIGLDEVHDGIAGTLGLPPEEVDAFMDDLWSEYLGTPNQQLIDYFASLQGQYATGILSNSFVGAREREQKRYGFDDICDVVVYSHEEGMKKPQEEFYRVVCNRLGVPATETIFVDDKDECLVGAAAVGMVPVKFVGQTATQAAVQAILDGDSDGWESSG